MFNNLIDVPKNTRFGFEIEMENVNKKEIEKLMYQIDPSIKVKEDKSLISSSAEIATPVYKNRKDDIKKLKKISAAIRGIDPTFDFCSFQVNLDMNLYECQKLNLLKAFAYYEKVIFRYSKGFDELLRESVSTYSDLLLFDLGFRLHRFGYLNPEVLYEYEENKRYGIALKSDINVVEFRTPNGTYNYDLWQDYLKTFYYFLDSIKNDRQDIDKIDYYIEKVLEEGDASHTLANRDFDKDENLAKEFAKTTFIDDASRSLFLKKYRKR